MSVRVLEGDAIVRLSEMEASSIDACVTDPPYGLSFMGKSWDHGVPGEPYWSEVLRVLKPGAHLVAFGGTRTYHRLTCAIEDSGFQIRDCLMWLYGSGFPKGKGCLKPAWEPIVLARKPAPAPWLNVDGCRVGTSKDIPTSASANQGFMKGWTGEREGTGGFDPNLGRWPANVVLSHEDGCREVGTKRVKGAGFENSRPSRQTGDVYGEHRDTPFASRADADGLETIIAFECQPNCAVRMLDEQSGERPASFRATGSVSSEDGVHATGRGLVARKPVPYTDTGGASRFFATFSAEVSCGAANIAATSSSPPSRSDDSAHAPVKAERSSESRCLAPSTNDTPSASELPPESGTPAIQCSDLRCSHESPRISTARTIRASDAVQFGLTDITTTTESHSMSAGCVGPAISNTTPRNSEPGAAALPIETEGTLRFRYCSKASPRERGSYNDWPTVKPLALMQWLVRLVTPTGGTVLDPFCGSGSTLIAADRGGFDAIGIDQDPHAIEITRRRVTEDARMFAEVV